MNITYEEINLMIELLKDSDTELAKKLLDKLQAILDKDL